MTKLGFTQGFWCSCLYRNKGLNIIAYAHRDNFLVKRKRDDLNRFSTTFQLLQACGDVT